MLSMKTFLNKEMTLKLEIKDKEIQNLKRSLAKKRRNWKYKK